MRISQIIYPRQTVLVTTCDKDGKPNIATFSFIMPVSFDPAYLAFSIAPGRFSFKNLQEVGEFVLNICTEDMLDAIWICGTNSGKDTDKFEMAGLVTTESLKVRPPRVKDCPVQLECIVEDMKEFGDHYLVVGRVSELHIEKSEFRPIYHHTGKEFYKLGDKIKV
jgi:flavin reductase (DIM6/NTAB) family NADH-FMN oxidoreductase RutF